MVDAVYPHDFDASGVFGSFGEVSRDDDPPESQPGGLADTLFGARGGAHLARQPDFARAADALSHGTVVVGGDHRRHDGQVQSRVGDLEPSGEVQEDVLLEHLHPDALFEHRQQHVHPPRVESRGRALGRAVGRAAHQRLHFDQVGSHAVGRSAHGDAAQRFLVVRELNKVKAIS